MREDRPNSIAGDTRLRKSGRRTLFVVIAVVVFLGLAALAYVVALVSEPGTAASDESEHLLRRSPATQSPLPQITARTGFFGPGSPAPYVLAAQGMAPEIVDIDWSESDGETWFFGEGRTGFFVFFDPSGRVTGWARWTDGGPDPAIALDVPEGTIASTAMGATVAQVVQANGPTPSHFDLEGRWIAYPAVPAGTFTGYFFDGYWLLERSEIYTDVSAR